jgi:hypothetical protein
VPFILSRIAIHEPPQTHQSLQYCPFSPEMLDIYNLARNRQICAVSTEALFQFQQQTAILPTGRRFGLSESASCSFFAPL